MLPRVLGRTRRKLELRFWLRCMALVRQSNFIAEHENVCARQGRPPILVPITIKAVIVINKYGLLANL